MDQEGASQKEYVEAEKLLRRAPEQQEKTNILVKSIPTR